MRPVDAEIDAKIFGHQVIGGSRTASFGIKDGLHPALNYTFERRLQFVFAKLAAHASQVFGVGSSWKTRA
jgi:hypothetical protein